MGTSCFTKVTSYDETGMPYFTKGCQLSLSLNNEKALCAGMGASTKH